MKYLLLIASLLTFQSTAHAYGIGDSFRMDPALMEGIRRSMAIMPIKRNIDAANARIGLLNSLIAEETRVLQKELNPRLADANYALSIFDGQGDTSSDAQIAVGQAIIYLQESLMTNRALRVAFDRMAKKIKFVSDRPLSDQIRAALPKMKLHASTRRTLEQWVNYVALLETTQNWKEIEQNLLPLLTDEKISTSAILVEHLRILHDRLGSDLERIKNERENHLEKIKVIESAIAGVNGKIAQYQTEISNLQKQIAEWNAAIARIRD